MRNWTEAQKSAIDIRNKRVLVSAAAGSGKTAVLVERIIQRIIDSEDPVDIDELLVMTFTRAAAAEMKERIVAGLETALSLFKPGTSQYERVKKQSILVDCARISTIDSFCMNIVRENIDMVELDPAFRVASEETLSLMRDDVMRELLEDRYEEASESFIKFAESYSGVKNDRRLAEYIEAVYKYSQSQPWPEKWLDSLLRDESMWREYICAEIRMAAEDTVRDIKRAIDICDEESGPAAYRATLEYELEQAVRLSKAKDYTEASELLGKFEFKNIGRAGKDTDAFLKDKVKSLRDSYKKLIKEELAKLFSSDEERIRRESADEKFMALELCSLAAEYGKRFSAKKAEKNLADFNDLEHMAMKILWEREGVRSHAALEYREGIKEIYIDEYQDSNALQEELVAAIENGNVFMVGDVKQSIYGFRQAKPELFIEKYNSYADIDNPDADNIRIDLSSNFRSRKSVLNSVNEIFARLMNRSFAGISYDESARLYAGADYQDFTEGERQTPGMTELLLCSSDPSEEREEDEDKKELEARMIALRIKELTDRESGLLISDGSGGFRPLKYSDIVILLRAQAGFAESFASVLTDEGIPAYAQTSSGYFDSLEIKRILAFLSALDNPYRDIDLAAYLRSPMADISDSELAYIMGLYKKKLNPGIKPHIYDACISAIDNEDIEKSLKPRLAEAFERLKSYRMKAEYMGLGRLLRLIYDETGYLNYVTAMPGGEVRRANLLMLLDKADEYADSGYRGLFDFVRYINRLKKYDTDFGEARTVGENDDIVRIMTIHKSKGLEFPVCFLAGMSKRFNMNDTKAQIIIDEKLGAGCDYVDTGLRIRSSSIKKNAIKYRKKNEALAEEMRVLYVAVTRARELLIMTAAVDDADKTLHKYEYIEAEAGEPLAGNTIRGASSYLDWIMMCSDGLKSCMDVRTVSSGDLLNYEKSRQRLAGELENEAENIYAGDADGRYAAEIERLINSEYLYKADAGLHTKMSVSELKRAGQNADNEEALIMYETLPEAYSNEESGRKAGSAESLKGSTDRGTAYHRLLELLDYKKVCDRESLRKFENELLSDGRMGKEALELVYETDILNWINSETGRMAAEAYREGRLKREAEFIMSLTAEELGISSSKEPVLIQGIVDAYIEYDDGIYIIDYKTDRVNGEEELKRRYSLQLEYYAKALERIREKEIKKKIIWSFALNKAIFL